MTTNPPKSKHPFARNRLHHSVKALPSLCNAAVDIKAIRANRAHVKEKLMKIRSIAIAVICTAACASASAASSDDDSSAVFGAAKLSTLQDITGSVKAGASSATVGADALRGASGNIGVNLAAGALNAQTNQIALITTPQAEIATQQNIHAVTRMTGSAIAEIGTGAMAAVSGNIGVNIAGGVANAQFNGLVVH
ncbi:hypothetical protein ABH945_000382 [Paraburkholderia sp. GAS333]|uniref:hypothetical protein n=1 Tax=Paraburkholderia sp. GAS333 TaxID=3156279 RepID=UPI003D22CFC2